MEGAENGVRVRALVSKKFENRFTIGPMNIISSEACFHIVIGLYEDI